MTFTPFSRSPEGSRMNGWIWLNLYIYIVTWKRTDEILVTLTPFLRSHKGLDCWKMACLHPISWRSRWILTKLAQLHCRDMKKNWLDFGDLDFIFKVTGGLRLLENGFSAPILQIKLVQLYCWDRDKNCLDFGNLDPIFKVRLGLRFWKMAPIDHTQAKGKINYIYNLFQW